MSHVISIDLGIGVRVQRHTQLQIINLYATHIEKNNRRCFAFLLTSGNKIVKTAMREQHWGAWALPSWMTTCIGFNVGGYHIYKSSYIAELEHSRIVLGRPITFNSWDPTARVLSPGPGTFRLEWSFKDVSTTNLLTPVGFLNQIMKIFNHEV